jgi:hypothetical protein
MASSITTSTVGTPRPTPPPVGHQLWTTDWIRVPVDESAPKRRRPFAPVFPPLLDMPDDGRHGF